MISNFKFLRQRRIRPLAENSAQGFTILEVVISIAIFSLLIFVTTTLVSHIFTGSKQQFLALDNVDNARSVTSRFVSELRNATVGVNGSYQIGTASNNQIIFYSKSATAASANRINYYLSGTTLLKGVTAPTGNPQVYNLANEVISTVQRDMSNGATPIFTYYDGTYNGTGSALTQPVNVNNIKYIKMNLVVLTQLQSPSTSTFSVSTGATIRNLKTNLGD